MKKILLAALLTTHLTAPMPVFAQSAPAGNTANQDICEDGEYVAATEVPEFDEPEADTPATGGATTGGTATGGTATGGTTPKPTTTAPKPTTTKPTTSKPTAVVNTPVKVPGANRVVNGQPVVVKSNKTNVSGLTPQMKDIMDDVYRTAARLGMPTPVITSARDSKHSNGSRHYSGNAIDLRCNGGYASIAKCRAWANELKIALGPRYDVIFEVFPNDPANNHIHIEYDPK